MVNDFSNEMGSQEKWRSRNEVDLMSVQTIEKPLQEV